MIIASEVVGVAFRYFDGTAWQDTWDGSIMGTDGMTPVGPPRDRNPVGYPSAGRQSEMRRMSSTLPARGGDRGRQRSGAGYKQHCWINDGFDDRLNDGLDDGGWAVRTFTKPVSRHTAASRNGVVLIAVLLVVTLLGLAALPIFRIDGSRAQGGRQRRARGTSAGPGRVGRELRRRTLVEQGFVYRHARLQPVR